MKKNKVFLLAAIAVAIAAMGIAYVVFFGSSDSYAESLPADATAIVRLDTKALLSAAKLGPKDLLKLLRKNREAQATDETALLGIDMKRPIYAFASAAGNFGLIAAVDDADDLGRYLDQRRDEGHASETTRQRGYSWVVVEQQWLLAFDDERALMMGPAVGTAQEQLRTEMARLLGQDRRDSGLQSTLFEELKKSDEPLAAIVAPEILPGEARNYLRQLKVTSREDALLRLSLETDDNELELDADVVAQSDEVKAELQDVNKLLRPIEGNLMEHTHDKNVLWIATNIQGTKVLELLRSDPTIRTALIGLNLVLDLDRIICAVDGDLAVELTDATPMSDVRTENNVLQNIFLTAHVSNTDFLSGAMSWGNGLVGVRALTKQDFSIDLGRSPLYFGVDDDILYIGSHLGLVTEKNEYLHRERSDIKGLRFFATMSFPDLVRQMDIDSDMPKALRCFERINFEMEDAGKFRLKFIAPESVNIARELLLTE